ncbi:MAG: RnfABCDGE type electron transport complex subunit G [Desulfobacterales bacterium]|nr:RnfABCDGE type electron transport complex subunit G [Desulfobacterales bacterium]
MGDMIKMVVVLTILSVVSGTLLAFARASTKERIENAVLENVQGPAVRKILEGATNNPIADRFRLMDGESESDFFVGKMDGDARYVVFETSGEGFGGPIGVMIGVNIADGKIVGVGVTTHSETPGIGSKAKTDVKFARQFIGMPLEGEFKVKPDGGAVDALSGATVSSKGVTAAITQASGRYDRLKTQIGEKAKGM